MKKLSKHLISLAIVAFLVLPLLAMPASAQTVIQNGITGLDTNLQGSGLAKADPKAVTARIINLALSFLALIALVIILIGGFKWMTAGGNEDKVGEAKKLLGAGIIGLVIVLAAWAIASWAVGTISNQIGGTGTL